MNIKHIFLIGSLLASAMASAQNLKNTFVDYKTLRLIKAEKEKDKINYTFSENHMSMQYCFVPFHYNDGIIELPKDKNGVNLPPVCETVSSTKHKYQLDLEEHFSTKKYDGVFSFDIYETSNFYNCFEFFDYNIEASNSYLIDIPKQCSEQMINFHIFALKKKKHLNHSTNEIYNKHVDHSRRDENKKEADIHLPLGYGGYSPGYAPFNGSINEGGFKMGY